MKILAWPRKEQQNAAQHQLSRARHTPRRPPVRGHVQGVRQAHEHRARRLRGVPQGATQGRQRGEGREACARSRLVARRAFGHHDCRGSTAQGGYNPFLYTH